MSLPQNAPTTLYDWPSWPLDQLLDELQDAGADARDDLRASDYMQVDTRTATAIREIRAELTRRAS